MKKTVLLSSAGIFACALSAAAQQVEESVTVVTETVVPVAPQATLQATPALWWIAPIASIIALIIAFFFYKSMMKSSEGNDTMKEIAQHVREGAMAYLWRQYKVVIVVFAVLFLIFAGLAFIGIQNPFVPVAFLTGGFFSGLCGYIGMKTATNASARTAQGASEGLNRGLRIAFTSGAVMGLVVVGLGLIDICLWYYILDKFFYTPENMVSGLKVANLVLVPENCTQVDKMIQITTTMITFGMGASTQALFARVGGGIYTKAADVGADLVGKVEAGIPEDDPRNPATIADNVGDNVGDVAGMGADLYESYCGSILATAALGAAVGAQRIASKTGDMGDVIELITAPMIVAGIGTVLSVIGMFMVRTKDGASQKDLLRSLLVGTLGSSVLILFALVGLKFLGFITWGIFGSVIAGLVSGVIIGQATEYYTSDEYNPTQGIANQANMGAATTIIDGLAVGMYSAGIPVITITIGIMCAFGFAGGFTDFSMGLYGIGFAAVGMLSTLGITLATDAYGPIADNAGGNAEMSKLPKEVRERTDALDSLGNTTAATGKGFAIGSAALTAMALLAAYIEEVKLWAGKFAAKGAAQFGGLIDQAEKITHGGKSEILAYVDVFEVHLMNPLLICGMFIGGMMAFVFCAMTMKAVGRAAGAMVDEVRRQFREMPGIMTGKEKPDYARCVEISTAGAQREMVIPSLLAIIVPVLTGLVFGVAGVIGLLAGGLVSGFLLATMLNNAGGAWDNAKKFIEKGAHGGKGSDAHKAGVIGDTVGDPCKDTSGPSLNILIKLMSMVSIVFTPVVVKLSPVVQKFLHINFS
ncbi:MAG: sodium-translocating pyrophosphatase [Lentisphaerae bacterium]|nr:sodium-translocating pyrophosphatase [Lentisphaerota bacterium]MCP4102480.1 sodium-translocating pyrophosphatase [Lentisphaerota bacterium]